MDRRELAEVLGKAHLRLLVERLTAKQDHEVLVPRLEDALEHALAERARSVDAANFRAERGRKRHDLHQCITLPPSTLKLCPVTKSLASDRRYSTVPTRSSGYCARPRARCLS